MSAINNAWNAAGLGQAVPKNPSDMDTWNDPRTVYGSPYQQAQMLRPMMARPKPSITEIPALLYDEIAQGQDIQRVWEGMDADSQWRMIERFHKQQEEKRMQEVIDSYDPNKENAYAVSLSTAVDLWRVKHGDAWVRAQQTYAEGDVYGELQVRLQDNNCFERLEKYNRTWLRLKENV